MAQFKPHKLVSTLPDPLEANSVYFVRAGAGFDIYVTNSSGTIVSYALNTPTPPATTSITYTYNSNGTVATTTEVIAGNNKVTTYNYTSGLLTSAVEVYLGVTKTTTYTRTSGKITSEVIT